MFKVASTDLINMGIMVISYTIKEITDDVGYLKALGQGRTAEVQRDARIGEAKAKMESSIAEAKVSFYAFYEKILKVSLDLIPSSSRSCEHFNFLFSFFG